MACQELARVLLLVMPSGLLRESARMISREPVLLCMQIVPSPCSGSTETAVLGMICIDAYPYLFVAICVHGGLAPRSLGRGCAAAAENEADP